jgi:Tripartite tricarboxylate transporter family receptor
MAVERCLPLTRIVGAIAVCLCGVLNAFGRADQPFYQGKVLDIVVFSTPGGPYDTYARLLATFLSNHIPGAPKVVVENMPGAGGLSAARYLYSEAPKDGTTIGELSQTLVFEPLLGVNAVNLDYTKFGWLGSMSQSTAIYVSWKASSKVKVAKDLLKRTLLVAGTGAGSETTITSNALNGILGTKIKLIQGYSGSPAALLAMAQGETDGAFPTLESLDTLHADWLRDHKLNLLFQVRQIPDPEIKSVPTVFSLATTDEQRQILQFMFPRDTLGRPFAAPPGVPPARLDLLRRAFDATMRDPGLLSEAKKMNVPIEETDGKGLANVVGDIYGTPKPVIDFVRKFIPQD